MRRAASWLFEPVPRGRVAVMRTLVYLFVFADLFVLRPWVDDHALVPTELYRPLFIERWLPLPVPTSGVVTFVEWGLLISAAFALFGRWPRLAGWLTFLFYLEWMFIAFSYGKVDHDRVAYLVALAVLPTVGPARWGDREADEAAGWAIHSIQVAAVLTYFLSVFAKLRYGGWNWATGATLMRAIVRRSTPLGEPLTNYPGLLVAAQFGIMAFEVSTPAMLLRGRVGRLMVLLAFAFHVVTFAAIGIMFWPQIVCLCAFLPLERLDPKGWWAARRERPRAEALA